MLEAVAGPLWPHWIFPHKKSPETHRARGSRRFGPGRFPFGGWLSAMNSPEPSPSRPLDFPEGAFDVVAADVAQDALIEGVVVEEHAVEVGLGLQHGDPAREHPE